MKRIATPKPRLDVRDLELVLAVGNAGSTVRAAALLHVTQSAVSRGLLLAEQKLGVRLFERSARGLAPTLAGKRLMSGAGPLLGQLLELEREAASPAEVPTQLRIACECYTAYRWLPSTLAALRQRACNLDVSLALEHTAEPVAALLAGELDVALVTTARVPAPLEQHPLFSDEIVFVVSRDHALAARATLTRRDLAEHTLIASTDTPKPEVRWFMATVFGSTRPKLSVLRFPLTEAMMDAARAGMGIAAMSEWIAEPYLEGGDLRVKRLKGRRIERPWRIAFRSSARVAAERLAGALVRSTPRLSPALGG